MPSSPSTLIGTTYAVANAALPPGGEGPRALAALLNFTGGATTAVVDLTPQTQPPVKLSVIQGVFIDNTLGTIALRMQQQQTRQIIQIEPGQQGYVPVLSTVPPVFNFAGAGNASPGIYIPVFFYNVPIAPMMWGPQIVQGLNFNGNNLLVQDTAAETSLASIAAALTPANPLRGAASTTGSGATTIIAAQGAGTQIKVTSLQAWNTSATTVTIQLNDSATTVLIVPAGGGTNVEFSTPLIVAANTALTFTPSGAETTVGVNAQGYF